MVFSGLRDWHTSDPKVPQPPFLTRTAVRMPGQNAGGCGTGSQREEPPECRGRADARRRFAERSGRDARDRALRAM